MLRLVPKATVHECGLPICVMAGLEHQSYCVTFLLYKRAKLASRIDVTEYSVGEDMVMATASLLSEKAKKIKRYDS